MPSLHVLTAEPAGDNVVTKLEEMLEIARKGELSSVAIAAVYRDGSSLAQWSKAPSFSCLLGAVVRLQYDLIRAAEEW